MANFERTSTTSTTTTATFLAPTLEAVELRIKKELKRNPAFEGASAEAKQRIVDKAPSLYELLKKLDGCPQPAVDSLVQNSKFWEILELAADQTEAGEATISFFRNVFTDLCA